MEKGGGVEGGGVHLKLGVQDHEAGRNLDVDGQRRGGVLENWTDHPLNVVMQITLNFILESFNFGSYFSETKSV